MGILLDAVLDVRSQISETVSFISRDVRLHSGGEAYFSRFQVTARRQIVEHAIESTNV